VSVATYDKEKKIIILKVVNTTMHEEKTRLNITGMSARSTADIIQLADLPEASNTFARPKDVMPVTKRISFSIGSPMIYNFPPNSITIMKLKAE
jgi:alpha-L-arabinofuranosidase